MLKSISNALVKGIYITALLLFVATVLLVSPALFAGDLDSFPWKPPYTAEQIMYLASAVWQNGYRTCDMLVTGIEVDGRGYMRQKMNPRKRVLFYDDYYAEFIAHKGKIQKGEPIKKDLILFLSPPAVKWQALLNCKYKQTEDYRKTVDWWVYIPALRTVRRLATGDRQDAVGGGDMTYDDVISREVYDEVHTLLGEDILPKSAAVTKPVECYVIKSVHKDSTYYLKKRITWVDKKTFASWREEQYDRKDTLVRILEKQWTFFEGHIIQPLWNDWNVQRNFRQLMLMKDYKFNAPFIEAEFSPDYLRKEIYWRRGVSTKDFARIKSLKDLPEKPPLLRDRFTDERTIILPEELEKEIMKGD